MAKTGETLTGSISFLPFLKVLICHVEVPLSCCLCWEIFFSIPPCLFTVHVRPVLSPCQAGNTFLRIQFHIHKEYMIIYRMFYLLYTFFGIIAPLCNRDHRKLLDKCSLTVYIRYNTLKTSFVFTFHIFFIHKYNRIIELSMPT